MASPTYTLQLVGLKCLEAQELDGDEIVLRLNGAPVWSSGRFKLHHRPAGEAQVDQFDFANGQRHGAAGWQMLMPYNPGDYLFKDLVGDSFFELWEADPLNRHDDLGRARVSAGDAGRGQISIVFAREGAQYMLIYRVSV